MYDIWSLLKPDRTSNSCQLLFTFNISSQTFLGSFGFKEEYEFFLTLCYNEKHMYLVMSILLNCVHISMACEQFFYNLYSISTVFTAMVVESDWSETSTQGGQLYEIALDRALGFPGAENNLNAIIHDIVLLVTDTN